MGTGQAPIAGTVFKCEDEVVQVLIEVGANPRAGEASVRIFGRNDLLGRCLGVLGVRNGDDTSTVPVWAMIKLRYHSTRFTHARSQISESSV